MAVYSGILDIANNNNALAALMGHEIAHALLDMDPKELAKEY